MNPQAWQKLLLVVGTATLVALLVPLANRRLPRRRGVMQREEPVETGRWESEGGNVPAANLSTDDDGTPVTGQP